MKVLVAEDDPVSRRVLTRALESRRYEVRVVEDGHAALAALQEPEGPAIALLDWIIPGMDGLEVCRQLRATKLEARPYVIVVSAKTQKPEIAAALDAGADDFISKPVSHDELLARMRVAERTIHYQTELREQIRQLAALTQRYSLLGEIVAQQLQPHEPEVIADPLADLDDLPPPVAATSAPPSNWFDKGEVEALVPRALTDLGLTARATVAPLGERATAVDSFTGWASFVDTSHHRWVDIVLEMAARDAHIVYERAMRRAAASPAEIASFLAETHNVIATALKAPLQARGCGIIAPLLSRAQARDLWEPALRIPAESASFRFDLDGVSLDLAIVCYPGEPKPRPPDLLAVGEILAEGFPAAENGKPPLFPAGTALTPHIIDQIAGFTDTMLTPPPVPVYQLSPIAQRFHRPSTARPSL